MGVTVFQYLVFTFLPGILGKGLAGTEFMWPKKELHLFGINFFDMAASNSMPYKSYARAFRSRRNDMLLQMHFGADYQKGNYGWTRDLAIIRKNFEW